MRTAAKTRAAKIGIRTEYGIPNKLTIDRFSRIERIGTESADIAPPIDQFVHNVALGFSRRAGCNPHHQ